MAFEIKIWQNWILDKMKHADGLSSAIQIKYDKNLSHIPFVYFYSFWSYKVPHFGNMGVIFR